MPRGNRWYASLDVSEDDVHRERSRSPRARQNCVGSMRQLMEDAGKKVECPVCGRAFTTFTTQKNRAQVCPIVPSHLPDFARMAELETEKAKRTKSATPRPY